MNPEHALIIARGLSCAGLILGILGIAMCILLALQQCPRTPAYRSKPEVRK